MDLRPLLEIFCTTRHILALKLKGWTLLSGPQFFFPFFPFLLCSQWFEFSFRHFSDTFLSLPIWRRWRTSRVRVNMAAFCQDGIGSSFRLDAPVLNMHLSEPTAVTLAALPCLPFSLGDSLNFIIKKNLSFRILFYSLDPPMGMCHSLIWTLLFEMCFPRVKVQVYLLLCHSYMSSSTKSLPSATFKVTNSIFQTAKE